MTQIVVTLENGANSTLLSRMIENMRGVLKVSVSQQSDLTLAEDRQDWINKMKQFSDSFDSSVIDSDDERAQYILSK